MASSSSSIAPPKLLYDAFISHRGPDVKETLAKHLYHLLHGRGCRAFLDRPEIQVGESITLAIRNGICSSLVQIAIFSPGYAESSWCLDELVLMLQQQPNALFIPVFCDVKPSELRHIENPKSRYAAAFSDYQSKGGYLDKLDEWKKALESAADISGHELSHSSCFASCFEWIWPSNLNNVCENIVSRVLQEMQERENRIPRDVAKYPVGLDERVQEFDISCSETQRDKVMIAGIYGLGGSGKTTLVAELFNRKSSGYHASCFLSDVRESHARGELHRLQSQLIEDLLKIEGLKIRDVRDGIGKLKQYLERARESDFLIVLDDIDHLDQLDALLPQGMLSSSSLVIITTRDQNVLTDADIRYKMKGLKRHQAKDLFCSHAFRDQDPPIAYEKLVESFLQFCGGLPLSLKVLGAHLYGRKEYYWELELEKVKKIQPKDIMQRLQISFDGLDQEEKQIFIDIACLFNKKFTNYPADPISMAKSIWRASGWSAEHALQTLQDKCLVEVTIDVFLRSEFEMHDHLRDLGRQLADELGPPRLWRPDTLRSLEAKGFQQILAETKGRCFHEFLDSTFPARFTYFMGNSNDSAETDLLGLQFLNWGSPKEIPPWVPLRKLHYLSVYNVLEMWSTFHQQTLETNTQASFELRHLRIVDCPCLEKLPDLIGMFSHLEELEVWDSFEETDITSLIESIKQLSTLRSFTLISCTGSIFRSDSISLEASTSSRMSSLETIYFWGLDNIEKLLVSGEFCPRLQSISISNSFKLETISISGLSSLTGLKVLEVQNCRGLKSLSSLAHQRRLEQFTIGGCRRLQSVEGFEEWQGLKSLAIEVPDNGYAWVRNCIYALKMLPSEKTILAGKPVDRASSRLDVNLFSEVTGVEAVVEMQRGVHHPLHMRSPSNAITIYAFLASSTLHDVSMHIGPIDIRYGSERMITVLLPRHNSEGINISSIKVNKGFTAVVNKRDEGKALTLMQTIVDGLYQ